MVQIEVVICPLKQGIVDLGFRNENPSDDIFVFFAKGIQINIQQFLNNGVVRELCLGFRGI